MLSVFPKISEYFFRYDQKTLIFLNNQLESDIVNREIILELTKPQISNLKPDYVRKAMIAINFRQIVKFVVKDICSMVFTDHNSQNLPYDLCPIYMKRKECQLNKNQILMIGLKDFKRSAQDFTNERMYKKNREEILKDIDKFLGNEIPVDVKKLSSFLI